MRFPGFLGNTQVKKALSDAFAAGRFPHAIAFQGEAGTGKRTLARLVAGALVCREPGQAPCGVCPSCIRAQAGSHPDIRIEEGSGKSHSISVQAAQDINEDAYRKPEEAQYSVFLLFIKNRMTDIVQNKLLKLIEEPPENAVFIITCNFAEQLLPTVRSRVQIYTLHPPPAEEAAGYFEGMIEAAQALRLAEICGGNIGRMLQEQNGGMLERAGKLSREIAALLLSNSEHELLSVTAPLIKDRYLLDEVLKCLHLIFRDACVMRIGGSVFLSDALKEARALETVPVKRLLRLQEVPGEYRRKLESNANMTLLVTSLCAQLRSVTGH